MKWNVVNGWRDQGEDIAWFCLFSCWMDRRRRCYGVNVLGCVVEFYPKGVESFFAA